MNSKSSLHMFGSTPAQCASSPIHQPAQIGFELSANIETATVACWATALRINKMSSKQKYMQIILLP